MKQEKKLSFEEAMGKLEEVIGKLEKGDLTLEESVNEFKEGMELSTHCSKLLDEAEKSITVLLKDADGNIDEQDFSL